MPSQVLAILGFDIDSDGQKELILSLADGTLEVRRLDTGDPIAKESFPSPVTALLVADYRMDGTNALICCSQNGEIRAYLPVAPSEMAASVAALLPSGATSTVSTDARQSIVGTVAKSAAPSAGIATIGLGTNIEALLVQLAQQRQELANEVQVLEENVAQLKARGQQAGLIPTSTEFQMELAADRPRGLLEMVLGPRTWEVCRSSGATVIRAVIIFADQMFEGGESMFCFNQHPTNELRVPLRPLKNAATELHVRALVGVPGGTAYHVFEMTQRLPKFALFCRAPVPATLPASSCTFQLPDRLQRVVLWLQQAFPMTFVPEFPDRFELYFQALGRPDTLYISMKPADGGQSSFAVRTDNMELAGDVVQDLCAFLQRTTLESTADFRQEMDTFQKVLERVLEFNALRLKLTADMADNSNAIKALVVRAEDARLLGNMPLMRAVLVELHAANQELLRAYRIRANNHQELLSCLKDVNQMIQKAARLRVGAPATRVVADARAAIRANRIQALQKIIQTGSAAS